MILTTTPTIEGKQIKDYLGVVTGKRFLGQTFFGISLPIFATWLGDVPERMRRSWVVRARLHFGKFKKRRSGLEPMPLWG